MASEFKNTEKFIRNYANQVEQEIETRLNNLGKVATGKLYDSIGYTIREVNGKFTLTFKMAEYGKWVDQGSKPSRFADSVNPNPAKKSKFIESLKKWCRIKGLPEGAAFPIRKKIWKLGQRPTNFFTIPTRRRRKQLEAGIAKNMALDVEAAVQKELKALKRKRRT